MVASGRVSPDLIEVLIRKGADVNLKMKNGNTALHELVTLENKSEPS